MTDNSKNEVTSDKKPEIEAKSYFDSTSQEDICLRLAVDYVEKNANKFSKLDWRGGPLDMRVFSSNLVVEIAHDRYNDCIKPKKLR